MLAQSVDFPLFFSEEAQFIQSIAQPQGLPHLQDKSTTAFSPGKIWPPPPNWNNS